VGSSTYPLAGQHVVQHPAQGPDLVWQPGLAGQHPGQGVRLLQARFGDLPDSLVQAIQSIPDLDVLDALSVRVLTATSLDEFAAALPARPDRTEDGERGEGPGK
jgi:hypothetical protein